MKLLTCIGAACVLSCALTALADDASERLQIEGGGGSRGMFDPSVTQDPATKQLWMSYSAFEASTHSRSAIGLRIAHSDDGKSWHDAGAVQKAADVIVGPLQASDAGELAVDANTRGTWQNETSTLVYDAAAPSAQRWKLFWHQTLWANDIPRHASYSWIALKMAETPEKLVAAETIKLFTGYLAKSAAEWAEMPAFSPVPAPPAIQLDKLDPQLGACVFGQPAALSTAEGLYLALDCAWLGSRPSLHTVLLRCAHPNCNVKDASSWKVVGRLTEPQDGPRLDERYKGFGGTALVESDGRYYLIATPVLAKDDRYDGCLILRFDDLATGKLQRERRGRLVVSRTVTGIEDTHRGACAAHSELKSGILISQVLSTASPRIMQIRSSGVQMP